MSGLIHLMLPLQKIYIDSRHCASDSKNSSDFKKQLACAYHLSPNTSFYITDITVPVSWYTVEAGRNYTIYVRTVSPEHNPGLIATNCTLPERTYSTSTLCSAMCEVMNANYPFAPLPNTFSDEIRTTR